MPEVRVYGKSVGFLIGIIEALACEHPKYERELKQCARQVRQKSVVSADQTTQRVYREILKGYATVEEIAARTKLAKITVQLHARKLLRQQLIFRARQPREQRRGSGGRGGDQCSYLYLPV